MGMAREPGLRQRFPAPKGAQGGHMGVAVEEEIPRPEGRQVLPVPHMAVGAVDQPLPQGQNGVIGQDGEGQHHLVHLAVAVAPDAEEPVPQAD